MMAEDDDETFGDALDKAGLNPSSRPRIVVRKGRPRNPLKRHELRSEDQGQGDETPAR
jgi:hypothetical protein